MSFVKELESSSDTKFVIPRAGKMFKSNSGKKEGQLLAFCLNKGYFETDTYDEMLDIVETLDEKFIQIGDIQKVQLDLSGIVFRQRIFFKSLKELLELCKLNGIKIIIPDDFHIDINNVMNILDELPNIERYAQKEGQTIEVWLTNTLFVNLNYLLEQQNMYSDVKQRVSDILDYRIGYMNRAPFLISSYDIDKKYSAVFLHLSDTKDERLISIKPDDTILRYGYTDNNIKLDKKGGAL